MSADFDFDKAAEPFKSASDMADDKLRGVLSKFSKWRSAVVLGAMALVTMVIPLISMGVGDPFSVEFWFNAVYSLAIATMSYYIFAPFGMRSERLESQTYAKVIAWWTELSNRVREGGLIEAFYKFCSVRREEERAESKALFIAAAGLPASIYEAEYAALTKKQLKAKRRSGELTTKQVKYLIAANSEIKVLPINPSMILSGLRVNNINDVGRERRRKLFGVIRPATLILTMIVRSAIRIGGNEDIAFVDYVTQTAMNLFVIVTWSFTGFRYGVSLVRDEEQVARGRSEFLSMFLERAKRSELAGEEKDETQEMEKRPT